MDWFELLIHDCMIWIFADEEIFDIKVLNHKPLDVFDFLGRALVWIPWMSEETQSVQVPKTTFFCDLILIRGRNDCAIQLMSSSANRR